MDENNASSAQIPGGMVQITLGVQELAQILRKTPATISADLVRRPHLIPPPLRLPGGNRLLWLVGDVIEWLNSHRAPPPTIPPVATQSAVLAPRKRRGRPPKAEKIASERMLAQGVTK